MNSLFTTAGVLLISGIAYNYLTKQAKKTKLLKIKKQLIDIKQTDRQITKEMDNTLYFYCKTTDLPITVINLATETGVLTPHSGYCIDDCSNKKFGIVVKEDFTIRKVTHERFFSSIFSTIIINAINSIVPKKLVGLDVVVASPFYNMNFTQNTTVKTRCLNTN